MIRFESWLYLLLLPLLFPFYGWLKRYVRRSSAYFYYSDSGHFPVCQQTLKQRFYQWRPLIYTIILALILLALARPQHGQKYIEETRHGVDIISIIDVSGTMAAEDMKPHNRLDTAKAVFKDFVRGRQNDRIGLVVFSGRSFTQVPLTTDYAALESFLDQVKLGMIEDGTAIGMAIATGINRLRKSQAESRVIILLTDGDNNAGEIDPVTAARMASTYHIKIYTIGIGKPGGAPVPFNHPVYGKMYYQNPDGSILLTKFNEDILIQIASITDGRYFRATDSGKLREIYKKIDQLEKTDIKVKDFTQYKELFMFMLVPAVILLLLEIMLSLFWVRKIP